MRKYSRFDSLLAVVLLGMIFIHDKSQAAPLYVLPDSLEIRTVNGQADFTLSKDRGEYVASVVFEPSFSEIFALYAKSGVPTASLTKLSLDYSAVNFLFDQSLGLLFKEMTYSANPNQVSIAIRFNSNLDEKTVRNLLMTNSIFGFVHASVDCQDYEDEFYCGFPVPNLTLKNQFRDQNLSTDQKLQRQEYFALVDFKNRSLLSDIKMTSVESLDEATGAALRMPDCVGLDAYHSGICGIIKKYSETGLLSEGIRSLVEIVFSGIDPLQRERLTAEWFPAIAVFQESESINAFKEESCLELSRALGRLTNVRISPTPYYLWQSNGRCSVLASGRYFIDLKFADDRSLRVQDKIWGLGIDAVFRVTSFGCQSKVFNIEGTHLESGYTLPPPPYFSCTGTGTDTTRCEYSRDERREFDSECSKSLKDVIGL